MENNSLILILIIVFAVFYFWSRSRRKRQSDIGKLKKVNRTQRISPPKVKNADGTKKPPEQLKAEWASYHDTQRQRSTAIAHEDRIKAQRVGSKAFIWRSAEDGGVCAECNKNNGKKFRWDKPPKTGLPGEGNCCPDGQCRCWAEVIIPPPKKS